MNKSLVTNMKSGNTATAAVKQYPGITFARGMKKRKWKAEINRKNIKWREFFITQRAAIAGLNSFIKSKGLRPVMLKKKRLLRIAVNKPDPSGIEPDPYPTVSLEGTIKTFPKGLKPRPQPPASTKFVVTNQAMFECRRCGRTMPGVAQRSAGLPVAPPTCTNQNCGSDQIGILFQVKRNISIAVRDSVLESAT
jgi:hypothetical protein